MVKESLAIAKEGETMVKESLAMAKESETMAKEGSIGDCSIKRDYFVPDGTWFNFVYFLLPIYSPIRDSDSGTGYW